MRRPGRHAFERWLEWLDSHDGRLYRRRQGYTETEYDIAATIPNPPGSAILTVGDLREAVELMQKGRETESKEATP